MESIVNKLAIVVPCYNEEEMLPLTIKTLSELLGNLISQNKIASDSFVVFIDDGSKDNTWNMIETESKIRSCVKGIKLAGNVGHQNALLAGLIRTAKEADILVSIDADLQDDILAIEEMVDKYHEGADIVYGVRNDRSTDSFFKRVTAQGFYKLMGMMGVKTVYNHADFRLMSKRAVEQLALYKESNLFLRGIVPQIGYKTDCVYYERKERMAGESKYPLKKMLELAFNGISSFSAKPITLITGLGGFIVVCCIFAVIYALTSYITGSVVPGWTSLMISIWFLGGVQLLSVGLIGQYISKIYMEVKERPRYNIEKELF